MKCDNAKSQNENFLVFLVVENGSKVVITSNEGKEKGTSRQ